MFFFSLISASRVSSQPKNMGICLVRCRSRVTSIESSSLTESTAFQGTVIVSLRNYRAPGPTEFTVRTGERLTVISEEGDFMMVRSTTTGCDGYIPTRYTAKVTHGWLFEGVCRNKALELLLQPENQNGSFLIRESETKRDSFSLSILRKDHSYLDGVKHYRISHLPNGFLYISPGLTFPSLHHLVEHYSESAHGLCCRLTAPCFIQGSRNAREAWPVPTAVRRPTVNWKDITRSVILRRKRTDSDNCLVSEGLREAIHSYIQMTEDDAHSWDT